MSLGCRPHPAWVSVDVVFDRMIGELANGTFLFDIPYSGSFKVAKITDVEHSIVFVPSMDFVGDKWNIYLLFACDEGVAFFYMKNKSFIVDGPTLHRCDLSTYRLYRYSFGFECRHALEMANG